MIIENYIKYKFKIKEYKFLKKRIEIESFLMKRNNLREWFIIGKKEMS